MDRFVFQRYVFYKCVAAVCFLFLLLSFIRYLFSQKWNVFALTLSLIMILAPILMSYPYHQFCDAFMLGLQNALCRVIWSIAISYIIFACTHNVGGPINWLLSHPCWELVAKLSYAIYLVHMAVLAMIMSTMKSPPYFSEMSAIRNCIAVFAISTFFAIIGTLAVELPIIAIYKSIGRSRNVPKLKLKE